LLLRLTTSQLKYLLKQRLYTEAQHTWLLKLHSYKFTVEYNKRKENIAADSLPRKEEEETTVLMITAVSSDWLEQLKSMVRSDEFFKELDRKWETGTLDVEVCIITKESYK